MWFTPSSTARRSTRIAERGRPAPASGTAGEPHRAEAHPVDGQVTERPVARSAAVVAIATDRTGNLAA